jgi:hypothetical protein
MLTAIIRAPSLLSNCCRASPRLILEINIRELLAHEAGGLFFNRPRRREATVGRLLDKKEKPRSAPRGFRLLTLRSCCIPRTEEGSSTAFSLFRPKPQSSDFLFHNDQGAGKRRAGMIACEKRKSPAASRGAFGGAAIRGWGCYLGCCARANLPNRDRGAKFLSAPSS